MTGQESHTGSNYHIPSLRRLNKCNGQSTSFHSQLLPRILTRSILKTAGNVVFLSGFPG
jgi:hypothetical protein